MYAFMHDPHGIRGTCPQIFGQLRTIQNNTMQMQIIIIPD